MILGKIIGKSTTNKFYFMIKGDAKKFMYVQVLDQNNHDVLAQVIEIEKDKDAIAECIVIGYRYKDKLKYLEFPLEPGNEVLEASDKLVEDVLGLNKINGAYIGNLEGR